MRTIPNLTAIRFFLALFVVLFHVPLFFLNRGLPNYFDLPIFQKGAEAVYMFFSLSGFLIIKQLYVEKEKTNTVNLRRFYLKRILRIFPLYYLVLVFGFLYYHIILPYFGFDYENNYSLIKGVLLSATFFTNIFILDAPGGIIEMLWSISIEEQFYLFIAPLFLLLPFRRIKVFLIVFSVVYILLYFFVFEFPLKEYKMMFYYFSFAGFCAILLKNKKFLQFVINYKYLLFLLLILYFTTNIFVDFLSEFFYHLIGMLGFGLSLSALSIKSIPFFNSRVINYFGKISYGIYMYHAIVLQGVGFVAMKYFNNVSSVLFIVFSNLSVISLTILLAHFSYQYYENFFLKLKKRV